MAANLGSFGTWRRTQACCVRSAVKTWWQDGLPAPVAGGSRWAPTTSHTYSGAFPQAAQVGAGHQGGGDGCLHAWHSPCLQTPTQGCRVPPPSSPLLAAQSSNLPSRLLLFCWCFVSHISGVTSPRHRSSEMDLMSLCFLQLRKTSKNLSLKHPEEPAGLCYCHCPHRRTDRTAKESSRLAG